MANDGRKPVNFNKATLDSLTFPPLNITQDWVKANAHPTVADPGWIIEDTKGKVEWKSTKQLAQQERMAPIQDCVIYAAFDCSQYFAEFAREVHFNKDGQEIIGGPVPE